MMLLGIDWFVVEYSRRKAAINVLFLCEMVVSFVCCWILFHVQYDMMYIYPYPFFFSFQVNNIIRTFHEYRNKV